MIKEKKTKFKIYNWNFLFYFFFFIEKLRKSSYKKKRIETGYTIIANIL